MVTGPLGLFSTLQLSKGNRTACQHRALRFDSHTHAFSGQEQHQRGSLALAAAAASRGPAAFSKRKRRAGPQVAINKSAYSVAKLSPNRCPKGEK